MYMAYCISYGISIIFDVHRYSIRIPHVECLDMFGTADQPQRG